MPSAARVASPARVEAHREGCDLALDVVLDDLPGRYVSVTLDGLGEPDAKLELGQAALDVTGGSASGYFYLAPGCHADAFTLDGRRLAALPSDPSGELLIDPSGQRCYAWRRVHPLRCVPRLAW